MDSENPLVTIIIPSYNHENYIEQSMRSVIDQTYNNIELIIIDDGSTDLSPQVIDTVIEQYGKGHNIRCLKQNNHGFIKTLNKALSMAKGDFIGFLASDDAYLSTKIQKCMDILRTSTPDIAAVYTDGYLINSKGEKTGRFTDKYPRPIFSNTYKELLIANWIPALGMFYKKSVFESIGQFDESLYFEDYDFLLRVAQKFKIVHTPEKLFLYRCHETNISKQSNKMQEAFDAIAKKNPALHSFNSFKSAIKDTKTWAILQHISFSNVDLLVRALIRKIQAQMNLQDISLYDLFFIMIKKYSAASHSKLRAVLSGLLGLKMGKGSRVYGKIEVVGNKSNIFIGENVQFLGSARLIVPYRYSKNLIIIDDNTVIDHNVILFSFGGNLHIGKNCFIGPNSILQSNGDVYIGNFTMISSNCAVYASNHRTDQTDIPYFRQGNRFEGITIGHNCWLATGVTVIDGTTVGNNCIVGANCVVRGKYEDNSIIIAKGLIGEDASGGG